LSSDTVLLNGFSLNLILSILWSICQLSGLLLRSFFVIWLLSVQINGLNSHTKIAQLRIQTASLVGVHRDSEELFFLGFNILRLVVVILNIVVIGHFLYSICLIILYYIFGVIL